MENRERKCLKKMNLANFHSTGVILVFHARSYWHLSISYAHQISRLGQSGFRAEPYPVSLIV